MHYFYELNGEPSALIWKKAIKTVLPSAPPTPSTVSSGFAVPKAISPASRSKGAPHHRRFTEG